MRNTLPELLKIPFPPIRRGPLTTLQVNLGYRCNQQCRHCHVNAGPQRREQMSSQTATAILRFLQRAPATTLDLTGGAPELNANFRRLVRGARALDMDVIDRCNLTILTLPDQQDLADFLAQHRVRVIASLPCYLQDNVDAQRGKGVYDASIDGLHRLNALGYGQPDSPLILDLVYNPQGASLPPPQQALEADYRHALRNRHGIEFNHLLTPTNMPIARFGSTLLSHGELTDYLDLLRSRHRDDNLNAVMCRNLISVDWQGRLYDCDFNQMLGLPLGGDTGPAASSGLHINDLAENQLPGRTIRVAGHCFGCTAGNGSSCGGALS